MSKLYKYRGRIPGAKNGLPYDTGVPLMRWANAPRLNPNCEMSAQFRSNHGDTQTPNVPILGPVQDFGRFLGKSPGSIHSPPGGGGVHSTSQPAGDTSDVGR